MSGARSSANTPVIKEVGLLKPVMQTPSTRRPWLVACAALAVVAIGIPPGLALPDVSLPDTSPLTVQMPPATTAEGQAGPTEWGQGRATGIQTGPAAPWRPLSAPGDNGGFSFRCESPTFPDGYQVSNDDMVVYGCPIRIYDSSYHFGSPKIAVNPSDSREAVFFALHGSPVNEGSAEQSRTGLTHVAFTTATRGLTWEDQPTDPGYPDGASMGDFASGALDSEGNVYSAYLWHRPLGGDEWDATIGLFKGGTTRDAGSVIRSYGNPFFIDGREIGNQILAAHVVYVPEKIPVNYTAEANETQAPSDEEDFGDATIDVERNDFIVTTWHERAVDWRNSTTGKSGWIDAVWTNSSSRNHWQGLAKSELIGPCFDASNPVSWNGDVYVACVVDKGYKARSRARVGDVDIWRIDPRDGTTHHMGFAGINGPNVRLATNEDGYMAVMTTKVVESQQVDVEASFGWYGRQWAPTGNIGPALHQMAGGRDIVSAHVTAIEMTVDQKILYLVYKEWNGPMDPDSLPDPGAILAGQPPRMNDYRKVVVAMTQCTFPLAATAMELGSGIDPYNYQAYMENPSGFNDVQDGLQYIREPNGEELVYFAISDYGAMQFGAIVSAAQGDVCPVPAPILSVPPPPIPQALGAGAPANLAVGAVVGAASLAMVGYLLAARRRAPSLVTALDK